MKLLIDGDGPLYRAAAAAQHNIYTVYIEGQEEMGWLSQHRYKRDCDAWIKENIRDGVEYVIEKETEIEPDYAAIHNIREIMGTLLSDTGCGDYEVFIGGDGNYRHEVNPDYKAGRAPRPYHYDTVKECLIREFGAVIVDGMETDDKLSIEQWRDYEQCHAAIREYEFQTCIVSIDKDLDTVPGHHYNWLKKEQYFLTEDEASVNFYTQLLTGDRTDNIRGLDGVGPVTAKKYLEAANTPYERYQVAVDKYDDAGRDDLETVARQIWMSKHEPNDWSPPEANEL